MRRLESRWAVAVWLYHRACLAILFDVSLAALQVDAQVLVLVNRTATVVPLELMVATASRKVTLNAGECLPMPLTGSGTLSFETGQGKKTYPVKACGVYYLGEVRPGVVDVGEIAISGYGTPAMKKGTAKKSTDPRVTSDLSEPVLTVVPVKVVYDAAGAVSAQVWQATIRRRFEAASRVFRRACFVEFKVVSIDTWRLSPGVAEFPEALSHLERVAKTEDEALLTVGFTDKLRTFEGKHMGGTRGPLHSHMLVRERIGRNSEKERLEVLVHELGHFLGAVHSPEGNSVMRPILGNRRTWVAPSGVIFDPLNTLAMCLVSNELRIKESVHLFEFSLAGRQKLKEIYTVMSESFPSDETARQYLELLGPVTGGSDSR